MPAPSTSSTPRTPPSVAELITQGFTAEQIAKLASLKAQHPFIEWTEEHRHWQRLQFLKWEREHGRR